MKAHGRETVEKLNPQIEERVTPTAQNPLFGCTTNPEMWGAHSWGLPAMRVRSDLITLATRHAWRVSRYCMHEVRAV